MTADADDSEIVWVKYTHLYGPPKHNIWKLKDEQYRVNGLNTLGGWMWISSTIERKFVPLPKKPSLNIRFDAPTSLVCFIFLVKCLLFYSADFYWIEKGLPAGKINKTFYIMANDWRICESRQESESPMLLALLSCCLFRLGNPLFLNTRNYVICFRNPLCH